MGSESLNLVQAGPHSYSSCMISSASDSHTEYRQIRLFFRVLARPIAGLPNRILRIHGKSLLIQFHPTPIAAASQELRVAQSETEKTRS